MITPASSGTEHTAAIIFGVTGDLAYRKLVPALYELDVLDKLPETLSIIGFARRDWDRSYMQEYFQKAVNEYSRSKPVQPDKLEHLLGKMYYHRSTFGDLEGYNRLNALLEEQSVNNRLYYLAVPPESYPTIIQNLGESGLARQRDGWTRVVIEKPYGYDLSSAQALDQCVHQVFSEDQVYRIDHYLGKETVQNILVFRFANGIFEPLWNRRNIDHVQITVAEKVGIGNRAGYYERAGVIRDMFQNHILQLLALTAMEAPVAFNADAVRDEKVKIFRALRPLQGEEVHKYTYRAQYVSGEIDGERVSGYKYESGVASDSITETYFAAQLFIDNWRWAGVPFFVRSGKRLPLRETHIDIHFRMVPLSLFGWRNLAGDAPNILTLKIQPDEGIDLTFGAKAPGPVNQIEPVNMTFDYVSAFGGEPPDAYERLLLDCMAGDATLFTRTDEVQSAWAFTTNIIEAWKSKPVKNLPVYEAGTWGPEGAEDFVRQVDDQGWHNG